MSNTPTTQLTSLLGLDPATYRSHSLHDTDRSYAETNCYTDILIELLHACGQEPLAAMGATVRIDFEGDQWTFFKPPPEDLELLFGLDIHEMQPYRPLPDQAAEQIEQGRTLIVELDSWYLPDAAATSPARIIVASSASATTSPRTCFPRTQSWCASTWVRGCAQRSYERPHAAACATISPAARRAIRLSASPASSSWTYRAC